MTDVDVDQWLESWVENSLRKPRPAQDKADLQKADLREQAKACAADAQAAGISIADLKEAAGGDLETFLLGHPSP